MAKKPVIEIIKDEKAPIVYKSKDEQVLELEGIIEAYKLQNPRKYELKKEALEAKLKALKGE